MIYEDLLLLTTEEKKELARMESFFTEVCQHLCLLSIVCARGPVKLFVLKVKSHLDSSTVDSILYQKRDFIRIFGGKFVSNPKPFVVYRENNIMDWVCHEYGIFIIK